MEFEGERYRYIHSLQGDIIAIVDSAGNTVVEYKYDAWGTNIGRECNTAYILSYLNPLYYRGYIYDREIGMYYLKTRYYYPGMHRFICADAVLINGLISSNLYGYCANSPIYRSDPGGDSWLRKILHSVNDFLNKFIDTTKVSAFLLNMKKDTKGVYHADFDCWQQIFGYNKLYDWVFDLGTSMMSKCFPFVSGGKDYILWMWKGNYLNLGAGAELGIYTGGGFHWSVDKNLAMNMSISLDRNGENIASWSARHWWITSFNPSITMVNATDLTARFSVTFDSIQMYYDFKASTNQWTFDDNTYTVSYTF